MSGATLNASDWVAVGRRALVAGDAEAALAAADAALALDAGHSGAQALRAEASTTPRFSGFTPFGGAASPFGAAPASPFAASAPRPAASPFSAAPPAPAPSASPFSAPSAAPAPVASPFAASPFGASPAPVAVPTPFAASPFGAAVAPAEPAVSKAPVAPSTEVEAAATSMLVALPPSTPQAAPAVAKSTEVESAATAMLPTLPAPKRSTERGPGAAVPAPAATENPPVFRPVGLDEPIPMPGATVARPDSRPGTALAGFTAEGARISTPGFGTPGAATRGAESMASLSELPNSSGAAFEPLAPLPPIATPRPQRAVEIVHDLPRPRSRERGDRPGGVFGNRSTSSNTIPVHVPPAETELVPAAAEPPPVMAAPVPPPIEPAAPPQVEAAPPNPFGANPFARQEATKRSDALFATVPFGFMAPTAPPASLTPSLPPAPVAPPPPVPGEMSRATNPFGVMPAEESRPPRSATPVPLPPAPPPAVVPSPQVPRQGRRNSSLKGMAPPVPPTPPTPPAPLPPAPPTFEAAPGFEGSGGDDEELPSTTEPTRIFKVVVPPEAFRGEGPAVPLPPSGEEDAGKYLQVEPTRVTAPPPPPPEIEVEVDVDVAEPPPAPRSPPRPPSFSGLRQKHVPPAPPPAAKGLGAPPPSFRAPPEPTPSPRRGGTPTPAPVAAQDALDLIDGPRTPAPRMAPPSEGEKLARIRSLLDFDDHSGALPLIDEVLAANPRHPEALAMRARCEQTLVGMFESQLGDLSHRPRLLMRPDQVIWLNLDHRAGFVLSQIDGSLTFEDLFDLSGMDRLDTARILVQLMEEKVISG